jgi:hypothetical protein
VHVQGNPPVGFPKSWTIAGYILLVGAAVFVGAIIYQETILTWTDGPQSLGFGNVHTGTVLLFFLIAFILLVGTSLWIVGSLVLLIKRKFSVPLVEWAPVFLLVALASILAIPYKNWELLSVHIADPGPQGNRFMLEASASGDQRLVAYLLRKGYDVNYEDAGGTTPLSGASVEGKKEMVLFLISKGADVNRKDHLIGETPLMAAAQMGKLETAKVLLDNEKPANVGIKNVVHLLLQERVRQRIQCLMLAAPRTKTIRKSEKVFLVNLIEDGDHDLLDKFVFQSRDS